MVWARPWDERSREYSPEGLVQGFLEAETRSFATGLDADLDLVRDRADDRDAEATFGELVEMALRLRQVESLALVGDLDHEPVGEQLVGDLHDTHDLVAVRMTDGVGRGFGQRQLEIREQLVGQFTEPGDARQSKTAERDVLGPGRDRQANPDGVAVGTGCHGVARTKESYLAKRRINY